MLIVDCVDWGGSTWEKIEFSEKCVSKQRSNGASGCFEVNS